MEFRFDQHQNQRERRWFLHQYTAWVKQVSNEVWSRQQVKLVNSFLLSAQQSPLQREQYLALKDTSLKYHRDRK